MIFDRSGSGGRFGNQKRRRAKAAVGEEHLKRATKITPDSPITWIEYGNGLMLLYGDKREDDAAEAYEKASKLKPKDAMEWLDVQFAKSELE